MPIKAEYKTRFADEIRIIPAWAYVVSGIVLIAAQVLFAIVMAKDPNAPPQWGRILIGLLAGVVLSLYVMLIGYINRDAGRRGMSRTLWTLLGIFVPNGLGIVLYFLLRKPFAGRCPQCDTAVQSDYAFCPVCRCTLHAVCSHCQKAVAPGCVYCPYCGGTVGSLSSPANVAQTK